MRSCSVRCSTFCSSVCAHSLNSAWDFRSAAVMALNESASWPNSSPLRTGICCCRSPDEMRLRARLQVAQRQEDQAVDEKADQQRGDEDETERKGRDHQHVAAHPAVHLVQRIANVEHAEHRRCSWHGGGRRSCNKRARCGSPPCCPSRRCPEGAVKVQVRLSLGTSDSGFPLPWQDEQSSALRSTV